MSKNNDAMGKKLDPSALYEPLTAHGRVVNGAPRVYGPGVELRGDHEAVRIAPSLWVRKDATSEEKAQARAARTARLRSEPIPQPVDLRAMKIAERRQIPLERTVVATDDFTFGFLPGARKGERHDVDDEVVRKAPMLFRYLDGSPVKQPDAAA